MGALEDDAVVALEATLRAATTTARRHFGFESTKLARGAVFDAVLLSRSPFDDVGALRQPLKVWPATGVAQV